MKFPWVLRLNRGVEVDENLARLRALARTQYAALFQNINDPRRARVTEAQPPLLTGALRLRTFAGRIGSGSGVSCKYEYPSVVKVSEVSKASRYGETSTSRNLP